MPSIEDGYTPPPLEHSEEAQRQVNAAMIMAHAVDRCRGSLDRFCELMERAASAADERAAERARNHRQTVILSAGIGATVGVFFAALMLLTGTRLNLQVTTEQKAQPQVAHATVLP